MANTVRLKRSAVQGKAPVVGDLSLGELAVNTYDGKLYMKKNDGSDAIVEIGAGGSITVDSSAPSSPSTGDLWYDTESARTFVWTGTEWADAAPDSGYATATTGDSAPANANNGDLWYRTSDNRMYVYYDDGDSQQWVDANPNLPVDAESWQRSGTTVSLVNSGDTVSLDGDLTVDTNTLHVDSTNDRVGIGTGSPTQKLEVNGAIVARGAAESLTSDGIYLQNKGSSVFDISAWRAGASGSILTFSTDSGSDDPAQERVRIDSNGNVGIGTDSPSGPLHVQNNDNSPGGVIQVWVADTGTNVRNAQLLAPEIDDTTEPFTFFTGNAWNFRVDSTNALTINSAGNVGIRTTSPGASLDVNGSLSKNSGSFKIDHPLPALTETHYLVHSFVEAPDASNLYAGMVDLVDGTATINIDTAHRMTEGTFEALNTLQSWSSSNESGYAPVKCSMSGNILTIECQDPTSADTVYYEVRGIRKDQHMLDTEWTDEGGRVITEPLKAGTDDAGL